MAAAVHLKDIVGALEMVSDEYPAFLNLDSGEVHSIERRLLGEAEDSDDEDEYEDYEKDPEWELAKQIVSSDRFVKLPTKFDIHEWEIMNQFATAFPKARISEELLDAIHGAGAFRTFENAIRRHHIEPAWYDFRAQALKQIAIDWCEEHDIGWE
jgi:hypothetical protein